MRRLAGVALTDGREQVCHHWRKRAATRSTRTSRISPPKAVPPRQPDHPANLPAVCVAAAPRTERALLDVAGLINASNGVVVPAAREASGRRCVSIADATQWRLPLRTPAVITALRHLDPVRGERTLLTLELADLGAAVARRYSSPIPSECGVFRPAPERARRSDSRAVSLLCLSRSA